MRTHVHRFVEALNACWREGNPDALASFYHPDVVLLPPDLGEPIRGRNAVVASYQEFLRAATLERFEETRLDVFSFAAGESATHMAHLRFEIDYQLDGENYLEQGLEVYAIIETAEGLQIIWRQQTVLDSRLAAKS